MAASIIPGIAPPFPKITIKFTSWGSKVTGKLFSVPGLICPHFYYFYTFLTVGKLLLDKRVLQFYKLLFLIASNRNLLRKQILRNLLKVSRSQDRSFNFLCCKTLRYVVVHIETLFPSLPSLLPFFWGITFQIE